MFRQIILFEAEDHYRFYISKGYSGSSKIPMANLLSSRLIFFQLQIIFLSRTLQVILHLIMVTTTVVCESMVPLLFIQNFILFISKLILQSTEGGRGKLVNFLVVIILSSIFPFLVRFQNNPFNQLFCFLFLINTSKLFLFMYCFIFSCLSISFLQLTYMLFIFTW